MENTKIIKLNEETLKSKLAKMYEVSADQIRIIKTCSPDCDSCSVEIQVDLSE